MTLCINIPDSLINIAQVQQYKGQTTKYLLDLYSYGWYMNVLNVLIIITHLQYYQ
jgi:hypothetical protein